jgi:hypothetical protein
MLVRIYMPSGLTSDTSFLVGNADAGIQNVIIDTKLVYPSQVSGPFNVSLGSLTQGYHLLELEYEGPAGGGSISLAVQTSAGEAVQLDRFRICVPNYTNAMIDYSVDTNTYFSGDDFFLGGLADKFINNVYLDGKSLWPEWMWDAGASGPIYNWGDGFMYPLGTPTVGLNTVNFNFENNGSGLLDFRYISRTSQPDDIGSPKFYASASINNLGGINDFVTVNDATIYGGSQWASNPGISIRNYTVLTKYNVTSRDTEGEWFNTVLDVEVGNWWATWELGGSQPPDVAIPLNFTVEKFTSGSATSKGMEWWDVFLTNYTIDTYSFMGLGIQGMEADEGQSTNIITPGWTIALNFVGSTIMTASRFIAPEVPEVAAIGAATGLGITGVVAILNYIQGQQVSRYDQTIQENNHWQLTAEKPMWLETLTNSTSSQSESDLIFLKFQTNGGQHCGLTKVVLKGTLEVVYDCGMDLFVPYPIGDIQITLCIPWFTWSQT